MRKIYKITLPYCIKCIKKQLIWCTITIVDLTYNNKSLVIYKLFLFICTLKMQILENKNIYEHNLMY